MTDRILCGREAASFWSLLTSFAFSKVNYGFVNFPTFFLSPAAQEETAALVTVATAPPVFFQLLFLNALFTFTQI